MRFKKRNRTDFIIIHCSATPPDVDVDVDDIRQWHRKRGFLDVGYHYVITRDGDIQEGRPLEAIGAHVRGKNSVSVGICLAGGVGFDGRTSEDNFTAAQWEALGTLLSDVQEVHYPEADIKGHNEFSQKDCPSFDVQHFLKQEGFV